MVRFGALLCHHQNKQYCPVSGVRLFTYELTNDSAYPLGLVSCPESGVKGKEHPMVAELAGQLPQLLTLSQEQRLMVMRQLIRQDAKHWHIGKTRYDDTHQECLADRGEHLLLDSTATITQHPNGSMRMIMAYEQPPLLKAIHISQQWLNTIAQQGLVKTGLVKQARGLAEQLLANHNPT
jgi:hypothetical protein